MNFSPVEFLNLSPDAAGAVAATAFLLLVLFDIYGASNTIPGDTPREIVVRWTAWAGRIGPLRATGAALPFLLGALLGHWFHPGSSPDALGDLSGLTAVIAIAAASSLVTGFLGVEADISGDSPRALVWPARQWSGVVAVLGVVIAAWVWPVGV